VHENILGSLPPSMGHLGKLQVLNASHNQLRTLPAGIAIGMTALQRLELQGNALVSIGDGLGLEDIPALHSVADAEWARAFSLRNLYAVSGGGGGGGGGGGAGAGAGLTRGRHGNPALATVSRSAAAPPAAAASKRSDSRSPERVSNQGRSPTRSPSPTREPARSPTRSPSALDIAVDDGSRRPLAFRKLAVSGPLLCARDSPALCERAR
jgi:Leucine-rich repeat (LRR) protein